MLRSKNVVYHFFSFLIISGDEEFLIVYNSKIGGGIES